jgi:hypothetical protein
MSKSDFEWRPMSPIKYFYRYNRYRGFSIDAIIVSIIIGAVLSLQYFLLMAVGVIYQQAITAVNAHDWWSVTGITFGVLLLTAIDITTLAALVGMMFGEIFDYCFRIYPPWHWWMYFGGCRVKPNLYIGDEALKAFPKWKVRNFNDEVVFFSRKDAMLFKLTN